MKVTAYHLDALQELINIGVGRAANTLNQMLEAHVTLKVPYLEIIEPENLNRRVSNWFERDPLSIVQMRFTGHFSGNALLVFPPASANQLVDIITGEELQSEPDLDEIKVGTLSEVGNIVLNGVMGMISNVLKQHLQYSLPDYHACQVVQLFNFDEMAGQVWGVLAQTQFSVQEHEITGEIILFFQVGSLDTLLTAIESVDTQS